jgi:hypothetical protein
MNWQLKLALFGLGVLVGAVGSAALSGRPSRLKSGAATALSHGLAFRDSVRTVVETARENLDDLAAEAGQKLQERRKGQTPEPGEAV